MNEDTYYYTAEVGAPMVYHDHKNCPDGEKIKTEHYRTGKGFGRRLCEECKAKG